MFQALYQGQFAPLSLADEALAVAASPAGRLYVLLALGLGGLVPPWLLAEIEASSADLQVVGKGDGPRVLVLFRNL